MGFALSNSLVQPSVGTAVVAGAGGNGHDGSCEFGGYM